MANEKNLVPNSERTPKERRENAKKAGKASGEKRKQRKFMKECISAILDHDITDEKALKMLGDMGIEDISNKMLIAVGLFNEAVRGNVQAFREIRNLIGEENKDMDLGRIEIIINALDDIAKQ